MTKLGNFGIAHLGPISDAIHKIGKERRDRANTHYGVRYNVHLLESIHRYAKDGHHTTRTNVLILDKKTDKMYQRIGFGQDLGNFHPTFIRAKRQYVNIEPLLNKTEDLFPPKETAFADRDHVAKLLKETA